MTTIINYFLLLGFAFAFCSVLFFSLKAIKLI